MDPAQYDCAANGSMTIEIPGDEHWIVQGAVLDDGTTLAPLDARFSSGSLSAASNAGVVLRWLSISHQSHWLAGGAFSYEGGDGAVLHFEHVHFIGNAAKFGGAINVGDSNTFPSYPVSAVDGGLRVIIADCVFRSNTAYKYGAVMVGDVWPLTMEMRDSVFVDNGADSVATNWEVGWLRPGAFDHVSPSYAENPDEPLPAELRGLVPDGSMADRPVHEWTAEQLHHHEPRHLRGHTAVRLHRCHFSNNSRCESNGDCTNRYFNKASNVGYLYVGPTVLINSAGHHIPLSLEVDNVTHGNIHNSLVSGIGVSGHSGNLTATVTGAEWSGARLHCDLAPYGVMYRGSSLVLKCDVDVPCRVQVARNKFVDNGYAGAHPVQSCNYAMAFAAILRGSGSLARVTDSVFARQYAPGPMGHGGAVFLVGPAKFFFVRCLFEANVAGGNAAAILAMANLQGLELFVIESVFVHNKVVHVDTSGWTKLVSVFSGASGTEDGNQRIMGRSVWRIDDGEVYGNMSYAPNSHYSHYVDLTAGPHTLHHGIIPDRLLATTSWDGGWIMLVEITPRIYPEFSDDRGEVYNCSNSMQAVNPCPKGDDSHILWSETPFWVGSAGAAIYTEGPASIVISSSTFRNNTATIPAASIELHWPTKLSITNTTFDDEDTAITPLAYKGMPAIDDCIRHDGEHMCDIGHSCTFVRFSTFCMPCAENEVGDGTTCRACAAGSMPSSDRAVCIPCEPGTAGRFGLCHPCLDGTISAVHGSSNCLPCPPASVPTANASACTCDTGYYDRTSHGLITCTDDDYSEDAFDTDAVYSVPRDEVRKNQTCLQCPPCLDCATTPITLRGGFAELQGERSEGRRNRTMVRCRPETARLANSEIHRDESRCLGGDLDTFGVVENCRDGHAGLLCFECSSGWGKSTKSVCAECADATGALEILKTLAMIAVGSAVTAAILVGLGSAVSSAERGSGTVGDGASTANPLHDSRATNVRKSKVRLPNVDDTSTPPTEDAGPSATPRQLFSLGLSVAVPPTKIFISYFQIVGNIGAVLHIQFPAELAGLVDFFRPLVSPVFRVLFECAGLRDFYTIWLTEIFVIPSVLFLVLVALFVCRRSAIGIAAARSMFFSESLFLLFLIYPFVTQKLFAVLNCRDLPGTSRLVVDYAVDCDASIQQMAWLLIIPFSFGVPIGLLVHLKLAKAARQKEFDGDVSRFVSRKMMLLLAHDSREDVVSCIIDMEQSNRYGTFVSSFKPAYFWWEPIDLLRKLVLVGMLAVVDKGSIAQIWAGIILSFCFFALHVKTLPFRYWEDNLLKGLVEAHIFVVLLFALTLKLDFHGESLNADDYDLLVTGSGVLMVPVAAVVCVALKCTRTEDLGGLEKESGDARSARLQLAFQRYLKARETPEDRSLLQALYASELDALQDCWHVFISYRVRSEHEFAKALCDKLSDLVLGGTRQKLRVYLDQKRLKDGQRWDDGFLSALKRTWIVVPVVSTQSLLPMKDLDAEKEGTDNVLLEMLVALELKSRGDAHAIMPIVLPSPEGQDFEWGLVDQLPKTEHKPTTSIARKQLTLDGVESTLASMDTKSEGAAGGELTTAGVVAAILRFQGVVMADRTDLDAACDRIFQTATAIMNTAELEDDDGGDDGDDDGTATGPEAG